MLGLSLAGPAIAVRQRPTASPAWSPSDLGASLLGWWDAEDAASLSLAGANVTTWTDKKGGFAASQAVSGSKPLYGATSFNGRPGIYFDGGDDELTLASTPFPTGASPCEIWVLVDQATLAADVTVRNVFTYGGATTGAGARSVRRVRGSGQNRAGAQVGDATGTIAVNSTAGDNFSGKHVVRLVVGASTTSLHVDGVASATATITPTTGTLRTRIGADVGAAASNFFNGYVSAILVTAPLSAGEAASLLSYLKTRGGIA